MEHIDIGVKRGACPRCRSNGKDRSGDNLALYPDGHSYCYSCGYWEISPLRKRIENKMTSSNVITIVKLPDDTTGYLPIEAAQWLRQYGITAQEVEKHKFMWSEKCKLLHVKISPSLPSFTSLRSSEELPTTPLRLRGTGRPAGRIHVTISASRPCLTAFFISNPTLSPTLIDLP